MLICCFIIRYRMVRGAKGRTEVAHKKKEEEYKEEAARGMDSDFPH
jgi:hypothetical protein